MFVKSVFDPLSIVREFLGIDLIQKRSSFSRKRTRKSFSLSPRKFMTFEVATDRYRSRLWNDENLFARKLGKHGDDQFPGDDQFTFTLRDTRNARSEGALTGLPLFSACRYTVTAERTAEMSRCEDGGTSCPRGRAPGFLPQKGGTGAGLQQVSRQDG